MNLFPGYSTLRTVIWRLRQSSASFLVWINRPPRRGSQKSLHDALFLRTSEQKKEYREGILSTTVADLQRVAERYLVDDRSCSVVLTDSKTASSDALGALGWLHHDL